jgi:hypothetical protein
VCADEDCIAGVCGGSVTLEGGDIISIAVADGVLYLAQRDPDDGSGGAGAGGAPVEAALDRGHIRTLPLDFDKSKLGPGHPVDNVISGFAIGTEGEKHVYFSGQNLFGALETTLQVCGPLACEDVDIRSLTIQVQSLVPVGLTLYAGLAGNAVVSLPIDEGTGKPLLPETTLVTSYAPLIPPDPQNGGLNQVAYTTFPEPSLLLATYDYVVDAEKTGAIYRAPLDALPLLGGGDSVAQWSQSFTAQGFVVAPDGTVFAHDAPTNLLKIAGDPPTTTVFDSNAGDRRAVDGSFVYVSSTGSPQVVRALAQDGSGEVAQAPAGSLDAAPIRAIDARDSQYVFYARANSIHRWPKPAR